MLDFVAAMRIERALQRLLELDEMLVAHVVEAMATASSVNSSRTVAIAVRVGIGRVRTSFPLILDGTDTSY